MQQHVLEGGFADTPRDAAFAFRAIMRAMARPGDIETVGGAEPAAPLSRAAGVVLLTLCDPETNIYLGARHDTAAVRDWLTFHTGAPFTGPEEAQFAIGDWDDLPHGAFAIGSAEYPDRSTTLIVEMPTLTNSGATLQGPGIKDTASLSLPDSDAFRANRTLFPLGLDFYFTCGDRLAGLPRTTRIS